MVFKMNKYRVHKDRGTQNHWKAFQKCCYALYKKIANSSQSGLSNRRCILAAQGTWKLLLINDGGQKKMDYTGHIAKKFT